jgi:ABC-type enterobactin transport system permease subunit
MNEMTDSELTLEFTTLRRRVVIITALSCVLLITACVFARIAVIGLSVVVAWLIGVVSTYNDAVILSRRNDRILNNVLDGEICKVAAK